MAEYGLEIIKTLSKELTEEYGKGFTKTNLYNFYLFYKTFPEIFHAASGKSLPTTNGCSKPRPYGGCAPSGGRTKVRPDDGCARMYAPTADLRRQPAYLVFG